jgi:UDP-N-acetylglucosamine pyrophosphorylase
MNIEKIESIDKTKLSIEKINEYKEVGSKEIKAGKLAILTLAGGQGTRLGHSGPKGTFELIPNKSLFEILCDKLKEARKAYGNTIYWYIMTSHENNSATIDFFETNNYFNYPKDHITFFIQHEIPMKTFDEKEFLDENGKIKYGANGHGDTFIALEETGMLKDIESKGIEWLFVTPVENPLIELVDDVFVGIAKKNHLDIIGKAVEKIDPMQKSGVFCLKDNKPSVIEYTELSEELAKKQDIDGKLFLRNAHINCNLFNVNTIEKIKNKEIPYHVNKKKAKFLDESGTVINPDSPNAFKYEKYIFDYFPFVDHLGVYMVDRAEEYEPVKDSPVKAKAAYIKKYNIKMA